MNMLLANKSTTEKYSIILQETKDKWRLSRIEMKEKLVKIAAEQVSKISENTDEESIGCPTMFCDELTKAKITYQELVLKQNAELEKVMEDYVQEMVENMAIDTVGNTNDALELKVYKDHINFAVTNWDYLKSNTNRVWPNGQIWNYSNNSEWWRANFKAVIDAKIAEEKAKHGDKKWHPPMSNETKQDEVVKKKKKKIVRRKKSKC